MPRTKIDPTTKEIIAFSKMARRWGLIADGEVLIPTYDDDYQTKTNEKKHSLHCKVGKEDLI